MEVMGAAVTTIAHASAVGGKGGSSNLQRFKAHHPPTFTGGGDPMVADHWFRRYGNHLRCYTDQTNGILARG